MTNVLLDTQQTLISSFLEIAVGQTVGTAREFLQATNWNLAEAIQRFFSGNDNVAAEAASFNSSPSMENNSTHWESEDNDDVRPPLPVKWKVLNGENSGLYNSDEEREQISSSTFATYDDNNTLAVLFRPPYELLYDGPFDYAKEAGIARNKWLLVNVQSRAEFTSDMLNRDTWANDIVAQMIKNNFVFWQEESDTEEGQKMRSWNGMVDPERLLEDAMNFIDRSPSEYHANLIKKQRERRRINRDRIEQEEDDHEEIKELICYLPLPEEPKCDRNLICRIAIRLPDGRRIQRNFMKTDSIKLLWSFCSTHLDEEETRPFQFKRAMPGANKFWATNFWDYDSNLTFVDSCLDNSIISVVMI
ncbi:plant UBX domain-containing protein 7-like [Solanum dulcamara]|uniref:plant UBX domain-containing protein 7-like n=1 Tax=Solanum dulcamara TaxID=45834 RepID=UPI00248567B0|nr:plant UBX domain-containing protein 7-like [Solanum dulcamara]